ncbi:MAG: hypothetical protein GXO69_01735 [Acidobacteria bacterium]|nr:hypothetical protein [Acidobacteriota bacterium]
MKHLSEKKSLFWIISLFLFLPVSCVRHPVRQINTHVDRRITSTFFRVEGKINGQSVHGVRAFLQTDSSGDFMLNLLTAMNSPLSTVFYDGKSLTVVDYRSRTYYVDRTLPFSPGPGFPFRFDIVSLAEFYRRGVAGQGGRTQTYSWGKLILTGELRIVALFNNGSNLLLTPLSKPEKRGGGPLVLKIPSAYRQLNEKN